MSIHIISYMNCYIRTTAIETRQQLSKSLLEEALKHGSVQCRTVVCLFVGVAGTGKTHMKHILLGKELPKSRTSTPLAEKPVRAVRVSAQNGKLQEVTPDELDKRVADSVALGDTKRTTFFIKFYIVTALRTGIKLVHHLTWLVDHVAALILTKDHVAALILPKDHVAALILPKDHVAALILLKDHVAALILLKDHLLPDLPIAVVV